MKTLQDYIKLAGCWQYARQFRNWDQIEDWDIVVNGDEAAKLVIEKIPAMAKALIEAETALKMSLSVIRGYRQYSEGAASEQYPGEHKIEQALAQIQALNGGEE